MKLFFVGLMGSGKSYCAQKLSAALNIPAFDLDKEIEQAEGKTVSEIFTEKGEDYFRKKENETLKSFSFRDNFLLSTGGGTPCFYDNMNWMNKNGITIWIDEPIEIIAARLQIEKSHRPLIASVSNHNLKDFLEQMLANRKPFYLKAKFHVAGSNISENEFLKIISAHG